MGLCVLFFVIYTKTLTGKAMEKISRTQALKQGLKRYYTGARCKHGHDSERYVLSCSCVACNYECVAVQREEMAIAKRQFKKMQENFKTEGELSL